jgi:hypothetical protein
MIANVLGDTIKSQIFHQGLGDLLMQGQKLNICAVLLLLTLWREGEYWNIISSVLVTNSSLSLEDLQDPQALGSLHKIHG